MVRYRIICFLLYTVLLPNRKGLLRSVSFFSISLKCQITKILLSCQEIQFILKSKIKFSFDFKFIFQKLFKFNYKVLTIKTIKGYPEHSTKICAQLGRKILRVKIDRYYNKSFVITLKRYVIHNFSFSVFCTRDHWRITVALTTPPSCQNSCC